MKNVIGKPAKLSHLVFHECKFQILKPLWFCCDRLQSHQIYSITRAVFQLIFYKYFCQLANTAGFRAIIFTATVISQVAHVRGQVVWRGQSGQWGRVGSWRWVIPSVYESEKCQLYVQTRLESLRDVSPTLSTFSDPCLPSSVLFGPQFLSHEFTWSIKLTLKKQTTCVAGNATVHG